MPTEWYIGLMSGTSLDGVDGVLADFSHTPCRIVHTASAAFAPELRAELLALNSSGNNELHRSALAGNALARIYADVVQQLLAQAALAPQHIRAIGVHGQTVRHCPRETLIHSSSQAGFAVLNAMQGANHSNSGAIARICNAAMRQNPQTAAARGIVQRFPNAFDGVGYTLQLGNPALLAECSGITVVADLRGRDVAAGGQGAPLVPPFHRYFFAAQETIGVLNLGGISNISILHADGGLQGWDCGPGNMLLDHWCQQHTGQPFDHEGLWGRTGSVHTALLQALLTEPFLKRPPPKSTGRDLFHAAWLEKHLHAAGHAKPQDIQATLVEYTARICAQDFARYAHGSKLLIVCGGGALNQYLMERLQAQLPAVRVESSSLHGIAPQQVEAAAFAWLARQCINGQPANAPEVTGAHGPRILGAIYPA